jgi:hypothetical protein
MRIDHAVLAVRDLEASAARLWEEHGLASLAGGIHPRWGTGNRIVPLGRDYVELLGVVDRDIGRGTWLGRRLLELSAEEDAWFSLCVGDPDIGATAARLGLEVEAGSRTRLDGTVLAWRGAGIETPDRPGSLPFFIDWDVPAPLHPGAAPIEHRVPVTGIARARTGGTPERLAAWLGGAVLPIEAVGGPERLLEVDLAVEGADPITLG